MCTSSGQGVLSVQLDDDVAVAGGGEGGASVIFIVRIAGVVDVQVLDGDLHRGPGARVQGNGVGRRRIRVTVGDDRLSVRFVVIFSRLCDRLAAAIVGNSDTAVLDLVGPCQGGQGRQDQGRRQQQGQGPPVALGLKEGKHGTPPAYIHTDIIYHRRRDLGRGKRE